MRSRLLILIALTLVALVGCNGGDSITGSVGERNIVGTIVPSGNLLGASPAGITVRTSGVGVEAMTTASGSFTLSGLPDGSVTLQFIRSSDGVNASLQVSPGVTQVTVELQKTTAAIQGSTDKPKIELEGEITAISEDSITLMDASRKMEVTCAITDETLIRHGNDQLTTDDLEVGDQVHIRARPEDDDTLTALEIKLQEGDDEEPGGQTKMELEGTILAIAIDSITVMDASTGEQTAAITDETVIRKGNTILTVDLLHKGDRVHVKARIEDDDSLTAEEIKLQNPA